VVDVRLHLHHGRRLYRNPADPTLEECRMSTEKSENMQKDDDKNQRQKDAGQQNQGGQKQQPGQQQQGHRESGGQQTGGQQPGGKPGNDNNMNRKEGSK
jgi:hypothetical protein